MWQESCHATASADVSLHDPVQDEDADRGGRHHRIETQLFTPAEAPPLGVASHTGQHHQHYDNSRMWKNNCHATASAARSQHDLFQDEDDDRGGRRHHIETLLFSPGEAPPLGVAGHTGHHHQRSRTWQDNCHAVSHHDPVQDDDDDDDDDRAGGRRHGLQTLFSPAAPPAAAGQSSGVTTSRLLFDHEWRIIDTKEE